MTADEQIEDAQRRIAAEIRRRDRRRLRRSPTLLGRAFLALLDRACLHTTELCRAYGGPGPDNTARVCDKPRWHWDSHRYGRWERSDGTVLTFEEWERTVRPWVVGR